MELLLLKDRVQIAREMGESHFREFKSGFEGDKLNKKPRAIKEVCSDISKTLVAFANADGGELLVGLEDDGEITGLDFDDELLNVLLSSPKNYVLKTTPLPTTKATLIDIDGKKVAYFSVPKGTEYVHITSDGKCLKRKDLESIPVSAELIQFEREERKSREYDREFIDGADINDLKIDLLNYIAKEYSKTISAEKFIQHLDLAEFDGTKLKLKKAALLLFARQPQKWHPRLQVRVIKVGGTELKSGQDYNVISDDEVTANIIELIDKAWDLLRPHLTETKFSSDAIFKSQIVYPELACKEALINSIAHRDYNIEGRGIEIYVYKDRMELKSPGELLSSINIEDIKKKTGVHQSRNTLVARVLREVGFMRELGEGFRRIYELMEKNDLVTPELFSGNKSFVVTLSQKMVYSKEETIWLENFKDVELSREERTVIRLGAKGELISPKTIWENVGIVDTDVYRQLLESLKQKGLLISEIAKPQAMAIARKKGIRDKKTIARFRIILPSKVSFENKYDKKQLDFSFRGIDDSDYAKLFLGNIPFTISEIEVDEAFSRFGEIVSISIPQTPFGKSRGYAFIEFDESKSAKNAMEASGSILIQGRKIYVKEYVEKEKVKPV